MKPNNINFYKYNFTNFVSSVKPTGKSSPVNRGDSYETIQKGLNNSIIAPQGLGELKHSALPKEQNYLNQSTGRNVSGIRDAISVTNDKIFDNKSEDFFKPPLNIRNKIEDEVRKRKLAGLACPFADNNNHCSALSIRCGDRTQYANPENREQKNMPHACLYRANKLGDHILIVDDNEAICSFCKTSLELFFHVKSDNISTASTGLRALEILNELKIASKQCGLLICSANLENSAGLHIIKEVFSRNYQTDILVTWDEKASKLPEADMKDMKYLITRKEIVKAVLLKPFHSETFIQSIKKIKENHALKQGSVQ